MSDRVKKQSMAVKPIKESSSETLAMRSDFLRAYRAPPASSPRMPKQPASRGWARRLMRRPGAGQAAPRRASSGERRLSLRAGSQAERNTVKAAVSNTTATTGHDSRNTAGTRPGRSAAARLTAAITAAQPPKPRAVPAARGSRARTAASCKRQRRSCRGVAPMLASSPSWCSRACMVISKALRSSRTRASTAAPHTASKKGSSRGGVASRGSVTR